MELLRDKDRKVSIAPSELIEKLKLLAEANPAFNAMAHAFAMRERTRKQVTVHSLTSSMAKEGYNYGKDDYRQALTKLSTLGVGRLEKNSRGRVVALKDISITLQSLGLAAINNKTNIKSATFKKNFTKLQVTAEPIKAVKTDNVLKKPIKETTLVMKIGHKTFSFDLFPESSVGKLLEAIEQIYDYKEGKK